MQEKGVLITGGSGLIGRKLTEALLQKGYQVNHLSRTPQSHPQVKSFLCNIDKNIIDDNCINGVQTIIHLAGAGIADKRWTIKRKQELINSRTKSIKLIYGLLGRIPNQVDTVLSASATGYYSNRGDELLTEESKAATEFLGICCVAWEKAVDEGSKFGLRVLKYRTGVVLAKEGGALPQLALPVKLGIGSALGNGKQWIPWIHWQDVVNMYLFAIENKGLAGVYNIAAPLPVTNKQLTKAVAAQMHRPLWLPNVPAFALKLIFGEMGSVVLGSTKVSAQKIESAGYNFKFPAISEALADIYA